MDTIPSNPFSDAFAASLGDNNPFRDRHISEASSSTAVDPSVAAADAAVAGKSELTRTIEEVDRQAEEVRQLLDGGAIATNNEEADEAVDEAASTQAVRGGSPGLRTGEQTPATTPQLPQSPSRVLTRRAPTISSIEREAVGLFHQMERGAIVCYTCRQNSNAATAGLWIYATTCLFVIASMVIFLTMEGKYDTKLFQGLLGFPFAALWSAMFLAGLALMTMRSPRQWGMKSGWQFFRYWGGILVIAMFLFYLVVGLVFKSRES